jgi:transitional endoplasmic reticulum ATPase
MLARITAAMAGAQFYEVSGPEVMSKWFGQSEELIRKIFEDAARQERAIIFFDEIDSVASQRRDAPHEASRRIVGQPARIYGWIYAGHERGSYRYDEPSARH